MPTIHARARTSEEVATGALSSPQVERIAVVARPVAAGQSPVLLGVTPGLAVHLSRTDAGVILVLEATPLHSGPAEAELPRVVGALRERGVTVAHASVRMVRRRAQVR